MADTGVSSIKSRIAALNLEEVHGPAPGTKPAYLYDQSTVKKKPPPPPPTSRPQGQRHLTVNNPPVHTHAPTTTASNTARQIANQPAAVKPDTPKISPALPPRLPPRSSPRAAPALPPRKSSEQSLSRRESVESISTISSSISTLSLGSSKTFPANRPSNGSLHQVRAPVYDPSKLPPLPPKKAPEDPKQSKATLQAMKSKITTVPKQTLPPQLPSRPPLPARAESKAQESQATSRAATVPLPPRRSALEFGMNKSTEAPPPVPTNRPSPSAASAPPPIPLSSRPNLDAIMASKPKPGAGSGCLKCRDFSGPDSHAARFPRTQLPSSDVGWLAHQLTSPFPSHTDKARTIFTWLHHNVEYDVHSFFSGTISPSTPEKTITSGLAVCEGYAGLFSALALKSGMEALVCSGDSKGFGHKPLQHGDPIPPFNCNHAWNAVRIDGGEWKLIDCCWGAGNVKCGGGGYEKKFKPSYFTMDNNEFGYKHFPQESNHQFRTDGRIMGFEEFKMDDMGGRLMVYGAASEDHGVGERTFQPTTRHLKVYAPHDAPVIRFQFATQCPHWDNERHGKGKPYVMVLHIGGRDGRSTEWIPFNTDGHLYWLDVNRIDLGAPGQKVSVYAVTSVNGQDARGLSYADYKAKKGRVAMGFGGVAMWELN